MQLSSRLTLEKHRMAKRSSFILYGSPGKKMLTSKKQANRNLMMFRFVKSIRSINVTPNP